MATPRKKLIDPVHRLHYHISSGCVRQSYLCGRDRKTGKDYSHRKQWFVKRLHQLVPCFGINLEAYAIMSNHFHLIVDFDPKASTRWTNEELVERWLNACPPKRNGKPDSTLRAERRISLLQDPAELQRISRKLGSISTFMKWLKQPISWRANVEDGCTGHFFEKRFWSGAILDERALLASMAYVDLNPIRAKITRTLRAYKHTSIHERIVARPLTRERLEESLSALVKGLEDDDADEETARAQQNGLKISLGQYIELLDLFTQRSNNGSRPDDPQERWIRDVTSLGKRQRAYGQSANLSAWLKQRSFRALEKSLSE